MKESEAEITGNSIILVRICPNMVPTIPILVFGSWTKSLGRQVIKHYTVMTPCPDSLEI